MILLKQRFGSGWVWLVLTKNNKLKDYVNTKPRQPIDECC